MYMTKKYWKFLRIWILVKWRQFLILIGFVIPGDLFLERAILKRHGRLEMEILITNLSA